MTNPYSSEQRPLRWPLRNPLAVGAEIEDTELLQLQWPTEDEDERINIVINLSLKEYAALASCVDVGRDIAFGKSSDYFWWLWLRILKSMTICDDVATCLTDSEAVIEALQKTIIDNGIYTNGAASAQTTIVENTFPLSERQSEDIQLPPSGCDKDILWAGVRELVERLSDQAKTVLENITSQADKFQRISEFLDAIPIVGGAADALVKNVVDSAQDMLNLFNAYDSVNNRDALACEIFELVCQECRYPTYEELYQAIAANAVGEFADLSLVNVASALAGFVTASAAAQSLAYHSMLAMELVVLYADSKFLNLWGRDAIGMMVALGEDLPSDDWELLCSGCEAPSCYEWDFTIDAQGWNVWSTLSRPFGVYTPGVGWQPEFSDAGSGSDAMNLYIENLNFGGNLNVSKIEVDAIWVEGGANRQMRCQAVQGTTNQGGQALQPTPIKDGLVNTYEAVFSQSGDGVRFHANSDYDTNDTDAFTVTRIRVYYTGQTPSGGAPC